MSRPGAGHESGRIVDIVRERAEREPERVCLTFYGPRDEPDQVTYGSLHREAAAFSTVFRNHGLAPGSPVVLFAYSTRRFVSAFLGMQRAGLLAIPVPRPDPLEPGRRSQERVAEIVQRCQARALFSPTPEPPAEELTSLLRAHHVAVLGPGELDHVDGREDPVRDEPYPFAYCQFTSGTGGRAKGVLLTHENIIAGLGARSAGYGLGEGDVAVSWLPLYHDMGLVGYLLQPLVTGFPCHVMSPLRFLRDPASWLALIARVGGTISTAPNFAYALCTRKIPDQELADLDLSSWRCAFNGSEPVTREVVEGFIRRFAPCGFRPDSMLPGYGLAENTLTATSRRPGHGARFDEVSLEGLAEGGRARPARGGESGRSVASVGQALPGQEVAIVDPQGIPLGEREIGEIALRGDTVMHGYLPDAEGEVVRRPDGWLLTGDLGYLAGGELFIVGRKKDLIIRAGHNYYPEDLEEAASQVPGVRAGRVIAFSVPGPERELVVLAAERRDEGDEEAATLGAAIRQAVFARIRFLPDDVVLLPPRSLPLTSSGKVMRPAAKQRYLEGRWKNP